MLARVVTAIIGIPIVIALVFWSGGLPFTALVGIAAVIGLNEFYRAVRRGGAHPRSPLGVAAGILLLVFGGVYGAAKGFSFLPYVAPTFTGAVLQALALELLRRQPKPLLNVGTTVLGLVYVPWLLLHFVWLRYAGDLTLLAIGPWKAEVGAWLVMFVLLVTWALDSGAYFVGRFYGRNKLAPTISPGKSIEGSVGGLGAAIIVGAVAAAIIGIPQPHGLILGGMIGIVGQIGDLSASAIKREVGIKDFGALMPGHGGILDRLDSLLFIAPAAFWYSSVFLREWVRL